MPEHHRSPALPATKQAGTCLHVTALPGPFGIGEIGEQAQLFIDDLRRMELAVWQFLPLGPTAFGDSPYQPLSTFAGNELLIDIGDLVQYGLLTATEVQRLRELPADHVDYGGLIPVKTALLEMAAHRFDATADAATKARRDAFIDDHDEWLHDYALFRILKAQHDLRPWPEWEPALAHHDDAALRRVEVAEAARLDAIKIQQFLFHDQWRRLREYAAAAGVKLFGDMPIYIALDSADAWANPGLLRIDRDGRPDSVAGVPPDYFSEDGQLWGNPLYDWPAHAADGYRWWIRRLRAALALADLVRIDHFRGFESYWAVPAGSETARDGRWEPGPGDALFSALRDALGELPIVAEDLGLITPEVTALRQRQRLPGMVVLQFDVTADDFDPAAVPRDSVCYTGTHDNDTTHGWFHGSPDDMRDADQVAHDRHVTLHRTGGQPESIAMDLVRLALSTDAQLAIAPLQDYLGLGSGARFNTPGTSVGNWRWRVTREQLDDNLSMRVALAVREAQRSPAACR